MTGKPRKRQAGGGRKGGLRRRSRSCYSSWSIKKRIPCRSLLGEVFELSQPRVNEWVHRLLPILKGALDELGVLPEREPEHFAQSEAQHGEPPELIIDGTERRRQRPKSPEKQAAALQWEEEDAW